MTTMRAAHYLHYHGGPSALHIMDSVPVPTPKFGELLVKVEAAGVNVIDWKIQDGLLWPFLPRQLPHTPGTDITGKVINVGHGVEGFKPGDKVISCLDLSKSGGYAEYALAPAASTVARPPSVSPKIAAALPVTAMTALQSAVHLARLRFDGSTPKQNILVIAASRGVGLFWVQFAKLAGCFVTATCKACDVGLLRNLGADEILDSETEEGARCESPSGRKYDVVVQLAPYQSMATFQLQLAEYAVIIDMTPTLKSWFRWVYCHVTFSKQRFLPFVMNSRDIGSLQMVTDLVEEGKLKVVVDSLFPLLNASDAWRKSIQGHCTGNVVLLIHWPMQRRKMETKAVITKRVERVEKNKKIWAWLETSDVAIPMVE